jgi:hypothetical protein
MAEGGVEMTRPLRSGQHWQDEDDRDHGRSERPGCAEPSTAPTPLPAFSHQDHSSLRRHLNNRGKTELRSASAPGLRRSNKAAVPLL